jgi:hypothetical protein
MYFNEVLVFTTLLSLGNSASLRAVEAGELSQVSKPRIVNVSDWHAIHNMQPIGGIGGQAIVTVTNRPDKAIKNLHGVMGSATLIILQTGDVWPGNLIKVAAFSAIAAALPADTVILFTDCCDVWFRPGTSVFARYLEESAVQGAKNEIVISAERGFSMIGDAGVATLKRYHNHLPSEFPNNDFEQKLGVPDKCDPLTDKVPRCLQSKFANAGLVIGFAGELHAFYGNVWARCEPCRHWEESKGKSSLSNISEQNEISDYMLAHPNSASIDYKMSIFHTTSGFVAENYKSDDDDNIYITLPGSKAEVKVLAPVIHSPGNAQSDAIVTKLRGSANKYWHGFFLQAARIDMASVYCNPVFLPILTLIVAVSTQLLATSDGNDNDAADKKTIAAVRPLSNWIELVVTTMVFFASASILVLLNKHIMVDHDLKAPCFVGSLGVLGTCVFAYAMVLLNYWKVQVPSQDNMFRVILPVSFFGSCALWAGNAVYIYLSVSLIQILKANTILLTFIFTSCFSLEAFTIAKLAGIGLIIIGMVVAKYGTFSDIALGDHGVFIVGLCVNFISNAAEAMRCTLLQLSLVKFSFQETICWGVPVMLALNLVIVALFERQAVLSTPIDVALAIKCVASMLTGCAVTVSGWWLTKLVGSVSVKIFGQCRNMGIVIAAMLYHLEFMNMSMAIGYSLTIAGSFIFLFGNATIMFTQRMLLSIKASRSYGSA